VHCGARRRAVERARRLKPENRYTQGQEIDVMHDAGDAIISTMPGALSGASPAATARRLVLRSALVVAMCSLTLFLNNGFMLIGISVFDPILLQRLHVSVGTLKLGDTITLLTLALSAPLAGWIIDELGPRVAFVVGMALMAAGMAAYAVATSIAQIYIIHVSFGLCLALCGAFATAIVVSTVTDRHRGVSLGCLLATSSFGMAVAPKILNGLRALVGWQHAVLIVACVTAVFVPVLWLALPRRVQGHSAETAIHGGMTLRSAMRSRVFWLLSVVAAIGYFSELGVVTNLVIFYSGEMGLGMARIGSLMLLMFLVSVLSHLVTGWLTDRLDRRVIHGCSILVMACGAAILGSHSPVLVGLGAALFGIGWGGNYVLLQYLLTHLFRGPEMGRIIGCIGVFEAAGAGFGPVSIGAVYDTAHSYAPAFYGVAALLAFALLAAIRIRSK
jgi:MFS family permease